MKEASGVYAGIDIGGTKIVAALGTGGGETIASESFPTSQSPETDLGRCLEWLGAQADTPPDA